MRTPVFELHILPMIRLIDREHMIGMFDLYDYDQVVTHAEVFADRVAVDMPPVSSGGPWPQEWVALFRRWMTTGYKRLELGQAQYTWTRAGRRALVTAVGNFPAGGYRGWLEMDATQETETSRTYKLYFERPDVPVLDPDTAFEIIDRYPATDQRSIYISDANGRVQIH